MKTVDKTYSSKTEVKHSKFLSFLVKIEQFESMRKELKAKHPKANHIVWAYRKLNEHNQIIEDSSDDGEPKGCAGKPVLHVMQGNVLIDCAILIVRYFGGIKLGTGGMARAYSEAAKAVVDVAKLSIYEREMQISFFTDYKALRKWEYLVSELNLAKIDRKFNEKGAYWSIYGTESAILKLQKKLNDASISFLVK